MIRLCVWICVLGACAVAMAQPLDWAQDVPLFATTGPERAPVLGMMPLSGRLRALCVLGEDTVCSKFSTDGGTSWSTCAMLMPSLGEPRLCVAADSQYTFVLAGGVLSASKTVYRFGPRENDWQGAVSATVAPERTGRLLASAMQSDVAAQAEEPYLNLCWMERAPQTNHYECWFAQSRDHGLSFEAERPLTSFDTPDEGSREIGVAVSWNGDAERIVVAAAVDRAGTVPDEVRIMTSDDSGTTWGDSTAIDPESFAQSELSLAAYGTNVLLVYSRRIHAAAQRNLFLSYSPDGGLTFSPPLEIADSSADEHTPRLVMDQSGQSFAVFYLADNAADEPATVLMLTGEVATPWAMSEPVAMTQTGAARRSGGLCAAAGPTGIAVMWAELFPLGDTDVMFDGSWRGVGVSGQVQLAATEISLGQNYPNPFNGVTVLPISLGRMGGAEVVICDVLGREVFATRLDGMPPGVHAVALDLSRLPSGDYWAMVRGSMATRRLVLVK